MCVFVCVWTTPLFELMATPLTRRNNSVFVNTAASVTCYTLVAQIIIHDHEPFRRHPATRFLRCVLLGLRTRGGSGPSPGTG